MSKPTPSFDNTPETPQTVIKASNDRTLKRKLASATTPTGQTPPTKARQNQNGQRMNNAVPQPTSLYGTPNVVFNRSNKFKLNNLPKFKNNLNYAV